MYKEIICLANSRKIQGRCIAGKDPHTHEWIRPISERKAGELSLDQIRYHDYSLPRILDIIKIPIAEVRPETYQKENMLIAGQSWKKIGEYSGALDSICDTPDTLWRNEGGYNDKISEEYLQTHEPETSLLLIKVDSIVLERSNYTGENMTKRKVRAQFSYNDVNYNLRVTDVQVEEEYLPQKVGIYPLEGGPRYLCLSLVKPFHGYCYKVIAAII